MIELKNNKSRQYGGYKSGKEIDYFKSKLKAIRLFLLFYSNKKKKKEEHLISIREINESKVLINFFLREYIN
jgi:hypothetical protein